MIKNKLKGCENVRVEAGSGAIIQIYGSVEHEQTEIFTAPQHCFEDTYFLVMRIIRHILFLVTISHLISGVGRASVCQCQRRNSPRFNSSILRHSRTGGAADEAVLIKAQPVFRICAVPHRFGSPGSRLSEIGISNNNVALLLTCSRYHIIDMAFYVYGNL
jgi:hypothetical protein